MRPPRRAADGGELHQLVADAGDHRDEQQPQESVSDRRRLPGQHEHQNARDHDDEQEARPASRMPRRELLRVLGSELEFRLMAEDGLVLRPVVFEDASHLTPLRDTPDVRQEKDNTDDAVDDVEQDRAVAPNPVRQPFGEDQRNVEEEQDAETEREHHRPGERELCFPSRLLRRELHVGLRLGRGLSARPPVAAFSPVATFSPIAAFTPVGLRDLLGIHRRARRVVERADAQRERLDEREPAPDDGEPEKPVLAGDGNELLGMHFDRPVRHPHRYGHVVRAAHHHALDDGLPAVVDLAARRAQSFDRHDRVIRIIGRGLFAAAAAAAITSARASGLDDRTLPRLSVLRLLLFVLVVLLVFHATLPPSRR